MKKLFVLGFAALLLMVFTIPAVADVKIGGIVFTDFYYINRNEENAQYRGVVEADATRADSYNVTTIQVPDITRLYARWTNEDNVGLYIELGLGQDEYGVDDSSSAGINTRHAYGWWDITPNFQILAGHHTTPFSPLNPSQLLGTASGSLNIIGLGYGDFYSGRFAQVRGTFRFSKNLRLEVCLVDPNNNLRFIDPGDLGDEVQNNNKIPRFDFTLPIYIGDFRIYPGFLWQRSSVDNTTGVLAASNVDTDLDTYFASLGFRWGIGGFGLAAEGNYGQNIGNTRGTAGVSGSTQLTDPVTGDEISIAASNVGLDANGNYFRDDSNTFSGWVDLSYKFGSIVPHVFFGYQKSEGDNLKNEGTSMMFGISVPISVAKGMTIRPEIAWYDDGDDNKLDTRTVGYTGTETGTIKQDYGSYFIGGVQFQITF
jgi:hypothetical protein